MRHIRAILALAASVIFFAAPPAAADDGRRHVMTPTQKIDLVRDLPDTPTFERDGLHFDLGYIYPIHTVNGASVASAGGDAGFVLYHDDRYARLTATDVAELRFVLGEDPTEGFTPPVPASSSRATRVDPWSANGNADNARGQPLSSSPARSSSARRGAGFTLGTFFLFFLVLFLRVRAVRDLVIGGTLAAIAAIARRKDEPEFALGPHVLDDTASARAATQRARLDALSTASSPAPNSAGGFGRKGA